MAKTRNQRKSDKSRKTTGTRKTAGTRKTTGTRKSDKSRKTEKYSKNRNSHYSTKCRDDIDCRISHFRDKKYPNQIWNTCVTTDDNKIHHILYVTPKNVIIKSIDTIQLPQFAVRMGLLTIDCKIAFTPICNESVYQFTFKRVKRCNKKHYVSCFLRNCGAWYVVMIQEISLLYNNFLYYKIKHAKNILNLAGELVFKPDMLLDLTPNSESQEFTFNPNYLEEITDTSPIRHLIERFVLEKVVANEVKHTGVDIVGFEALDLAT